MVLWGQRRRQEGESGGRSSSRKKKKWTKIFHFRSKKNSALEESPSAEVKAEQPRQKQQRSLSEKERREQPPQHAVLDAPPSPASVTSNSTSGDVGKQNMTEETQVASAVAPKTSASPPPSSPPPDPESRYSDKTPKNSNSIASTSIPQIATVSTLAPKILKKPALASNQKRQTDLPDWWKGERKDASSRKLGKAAKETPRQSQVAPNDSMPPSTPQTRRKSPPKISAPQTSRSVPQIATVAAMAPWIMNKPYPDRKRATRQDLPSKKSASKTTNNRRSSSIPETATVAAIVPGVMATNQKRRTREGCLPTKKTTSETTTSTSGVPQIATIAAMAPWIKKKSELAINQKRQTRPDFPSKKSASKTTHTTTSPSNSIPQIATVAAMAPKIMNKPKPTNQKRRTDLPEWWKEEREEASSARGSNAFKTSGRDLTAKEKSSDTFVAGTSDHAAGATTAESSAKEGSPTEATPLIVPGSRTVTTEPREQETHHGGKTHDLRCIPQIATIADLGPKVLGNPRLSTPTMLRNTRPSTALPDWWKQGPSEKLVSQGRRQDQLLSASWHATPAQGSALKQVHGLLEKEMTSVSLHSKDPAVSRRSSDVARQGVFASDPAAKLTSDEPTQEQHSLESTPSKEDPATSNQENRLSKEVQLLKLSEELATDFDSPGTATLPTPEEPTTPPKEENTLSMDMELVKESEALPGEVNGPVTSANLVSKDSPLAEDDCCESIDLDSSFSDDAPKVKPANLSSGTLTLAAEGSDYLGLAPARNAKNLFPALIGGLVAAYALSGLLNQLQYLQLIFF